jgi:3-phytase
VTIGAFHGDLITVSHGTGIKAYTVDPSTRQLVQVNEGNVIGTGNPEGLCMYDSPNGTVYVTTLKREGAILRQFRLSDDDNNGQLSATQVRQFHVGGIAEGCAIDDANGAMYIAVEQVALWRYGAQPTSGQTRTMVDSLQPSGHLEHDIEGIALVTQPGGGGWLIASSQFFSDPGHSYFVVYDRSTNAYQKSFRIVKGPVADGCERTDGIAAYAGNLGPLYPKGIFVCQDNSNRAPGVGAQDFKFTKLEKILPVA